MLMRYSNRDSRRYWLYYLGCKGQNQAEEINVGVVSIEILCRDRRG